MKLTVVEQITDTESNAIEGGVVQMGARAYIPILGRFVSVDPVEAGTDNAYAYVNDPVNKNDFSGKAWWNDAVNWIGKNADTIDIGVAGLTFGLCVVATAGACAAVTGAAVAAGAIVAMAQSSQQSGGNVAKAVGAGFISAGTDLAH